MRIIHTADWHLDGSKSLPDYLNRQEAAIHEVFNIARKYKVDVLLMAGDVFNHHIVSEEARKLFFRLLAEGDKEDFTSVYINGNHDIYKEEGSVVSLFHEVSHSLMSRTHIVDMKPRLIAIEELSIMAIPYKDGLTTNMLKEEIRKGYKEHKGKYYVPMSHLMIKGCIRDNGTKSPIGTELPKAKWDYFALGDIHKYQKIGPNAFYSGSPIQHKFGEDLPKGVVIVDLESGKRKFVEIKSPNIRKLITITKVPETWPANAWVRFKGSKVPQDLPPEVIKKATEIEQEDVSNDIQLDDVTLGLPEFAASRGVKKKAQKRLVKMVRMYTDRVKEYNNP